MCEIAILDNEKYSKHEMTNAARTLYNAMGDSLGLVAINDVGPEYNFEVFKAVEPHIPAIGDWIESNVGDETERLIIHGRLATAGDVNVENAHPLKIGCDMCDANFVIHNGVISQHYQLRNRHNQEGHEYRTNVDSESIVHELGGVPDFGDVYETTLAYEPAFIVGNTQEVYVFTQGKYQLTEDVRLALSHRDFGPSRDEKTEYTEAKIIHPEADN